VEGFSGALKEGIGNASKATTRAVK
jgi:hypothetical protein